ncbi:endonuclease/exonuclease/phosphatase family protein [bacterium CPR1]|nr:endonuclease/exonuclease/phosphatase family protein [bacterium CPR1]
MEAGSIKSNTAYRGVPGVRYAAPEGEPQDGFLPQPSSDEGETQGKSHRLRKLALGSMLALGVLGTAAGAGSYALAHAPVCAQAAPITLTDRGLCISPELGLTGAHVWRILEGIPSLPDAARGLESSRNQVTLAEGRPAWRAMEGGDLKAVTWNLHHERSRDADGARPQLEKMIQAMIDQQADVYLLQEVSPGHVNELVEGLGMHGYYSQTTLLQGNLVLVHPDLPVTTHSSRVLLNDGGGLQELQEWALQGDGQEPRSLQTVEVRLPNAREALLWNTHMPTHNYTDAQRAEAREAVIEELASQADPGQLVVGGGDLNAGADGSLANELRQDGHQVHAFHIDSINTRNAAGPVEFEGFKLHDAQGVQISDHPMAVAKVPV